MIPSAMPSRNLHKGAGCPQRVNLNYIGGLLRFLPPEPDTVPPSPQMLEVLATAHTGNNVIDAISTRRIWKEKRNSVPIGVKKDAAELGPHDGDACSSAVQVPHSLALVTRRPLACFAMVFFFFFCF